MSGLTQGLVGDESLYSKALDNMLIADLHAKIDKFWEENFKSYTGYTYPQMWWYQWLLIMLDKVENPSNSHWA